MSKSLYDEQLQKDVQMILDAKYITLTELSRRNSVSKSALSLWLHSKYKGDPSNLESKLRAWLRSFSKAMTLCVADEHRLVRIYAILDEAKDPRAIVNRAHEVRG